jgi:hypothetical protein
MVEGLTMADVHSIEPGAVCDSACSQILPLSWNTADIYVYDGVREQSVGNVIDVDVEVQGEDQAVFGGPEECGAAREETFITGVTVTVNCDYITAMNLSLFTGGKASTASPDGHRRWGISYMAERPTFQIRIEHALQDGHFLNVVLRRAVFIATWKLALRSGDFFTYPLTIKGYPAREFVDFEYGYMEKTV